MVIKAYIYTRFSSTIQEEGDSVRRQTELANNFVKNHPELNLVIDNTFDLDDRGVSAFKGKNIESGKLGDFIKAAKEGLIEKGSYLLVENADRMSRAGIFDSLSVVFEILNLDIIIATLSPERILTKRINQFEMMSQIMEASRANQESEIKRKRVQAAWSNKRMMAVKNKKILTKWTRKWIDIDADGTGFVLNEERAEVVNNIFNWTVDGMGLRLILQKLEKMNIPAWDLGKDIIKKKVSGPNDSLDVTSSKKKRNVIPPKGWHGSYITRMLRDRAVLGELVMKGRGKEEDTVVEDYYPRVISDEVFYKVQEIKNERNVKTRGHGAGRKGETFANLFSGLVVCGYSYENNLGVHRCSGNEERMSYVNKGNKQAQKYLQCARIKEGHIGCDECRKLWNYYSFEYVFLLHAKEVDVSTIFGTKNKMEMEIEEKRKQVTILNGKLMENEVRRKKMESTITQILDGEGVLPDTYREMLIKFESDNNKLKKDIEKAKIDLSLKENEYLASKSTHDKMIDLIDEMKNMNGDDLFQTRMKLNSLLKNIIDKIDVYTNGRVYSDKYYEEIQKDLGVPEDDAIEMKKIHKLQPKHPFFVIHYKSGEKRCVVPELDKPEKAMITMKWDDTGMIEAETPMGNRKFNNRVKKN